MMNKTQESNDLKEILETNKSISLAKLSPLDLYQELNSLTSLYLHDLVLATRQIGKLD